MVSVEAPTGSYSPFLTVPSYPLLQPGGHRTPGAGQVVTQEPGMLRLGLLFLKSSPYPSGSHRDETILDDLHGNKRFFEGEVFYS